MHLLISINSSWNVMNFRRHLISSLLADGHELTILAPREPEAAGLEAMGCRVVHLDMDRKGLSPLRDLRLLWSFFVLFRRLSPDAILSFTIKNNIYGAFASRAAGVPFLPNVTGLGTIFLQNSWATRLAIWLYRRAFRSLPLVFFQNSDDRDLFVEKRIVAEPQSRILPGSGIDLDHFVPTPLPDGTETTFLLIGRILRDKGVHEYVDAARSLRRKGHAARFQLLGFLDADNRTAIGRKIMDGWVGEGIVEYLGSASDVRDAIRNADCIVLPSYREGTPRTLLEGAAMARPLVATDVPGCRQVVDDGVNGFLCRVQDADDLASAMEKMIAAGPRGREVMGAAGRARMMRDYDQNIVVAAYRAAIDRIAPRSVRRR